LPLLIRDSINVPTDDIDNIIAVLKCNDRVVKIDVYNVDGSELKYVLAAMQVPFPELTHLRLTDKGMVSVIPDSFLGGSAPCL
jgi:hypothetical protein